ncbi:MAG: hypothetical protein L0Z53_00270 [Acidobacteriales bacterium]|nr:hypothetical protein [Terriglobales bacterium]
MKHMKKSHMMKKSSSKQTQTVKNLPSERTQNVTGQMDVTKKHSSGGKSNGGGKKKKGY